MGFWADPFFDVNPFLHSARPIRFGRGLARPGIPASTFKSFVWKVSLAILLTCHRYPRACVALRWQDSYVRFFCLPLPTWPKSAHSCPKMPVAAGDYHIMIQNTARLPACCTLSGHSRHLSRGVDNSSNPVTDTCSLQCSWPLAHPPLPHKHYTECVQLQSTVYSLQSTAPTAYIIQHTDRCNIHHTP
jgi:hypothetical protein